MQMRASNEELQQMQDELLKDCIDDPEDIARWMCKFGPNLITEALEYRKFKADLLLRYFPELDRD